MFDRDLCTGGFPDGPSRWYRHAGRHTAPEDVRDAPEPARLVHLHYHLYLCRDRSVHTIRSRRRSLQYGHPPDLPQFLIDPHEAGQLRPVRDRLRGYRITVRARGNRNREDRQVAPAETVHDVYTADEVSQRLVTFSSASASQHACPRRSRLGRWDRASARPGKDRAALPGPADRCPTGVPRHPAGAIQRPTWHRYPGPAPLTTVQAWVSVGAAARGCPASSCSPGSRA